MNRLIPIAVLLALTACGTGDPVPTATEARQEADAAGALSAAEGPRVVTPGGAQIDVEVASTPATRARGLMFRDHLPRGRGMIFIFPNEEIQSFWMKNTLIPLDMVWINSEDSIVHIEQRVPPCPGEPCPSYTSDARAKYVLELSGGEAAHFGLKVGDRLLIHGLDSFRVE